jgi:uncharacterized membrane protein YphA (DoxX/SURF4 family)
MEKTVDIRSMRLLLQVLLGMLFLYAAGQKLFVSGVAQFAVEVANYKLLPESMVLMVAYFLPWLEVATGICLMLNFWREGASVCAIGMTLVFCGGIGWAWSQGLDITCGCFGKADATVNYPWKMLQLLAQLAVAIFVAIGTVWTLDGLADAMGPAQGKNS